MTYVIVEEPVSKGVSCATLANSLKKQYFCEKCNSAFSKLCYLRLHMKLHAFTCSLCSKRFFYKSLLRRHLRIEHKFTKVKYKEEKFVCEKCSKIFYTNREFKFHLRTDHRDQFVCRKIDCRKVFKSKKEYDDHREQHKVEPCEVCGKIVKHIRSHMLTHHSKNYLCRMCNKYFRFRSDLRKHLLIHLKIKQHTCTICGKSFTQKYNLVVHRRSHTGLRLYKCKICHLSFIRSNALSLHEKTIHDGKETRKFSCDKCPFTAATRWRVNEHKNLFHISFFKEIFQCNICGSVLKCQKSLETHSWTHSDEKPFPCPHCIQQYATKAALTKHLKRFHL